jgi:hypothetical protein
VDERLRLVARLLEGEKIAERFRPGSLPLPRALSLAIRPERLDLYLPFKHSHCRLRHVRGVVVGICGDTDGAHHR